MALNEYSLVSASAGDSSTVSVSTVFNSSSLVCPSRISSRTFSTPSPI